MKKKKRTVKHKLNITKIEMRLMDVVLQNVVCKNSKKEKAR
jgi:hypothetical protein